MVRRSRYCIRARAGDFAAKVFTSDGLTMVFTSDDSASSPSGQEMMAAYEDAIERMQTKLFVSDGNTRVTGTGRTGSNQEVAGARQGWYKEGKTEVMKMILKKDFHTGVSYYPRFA